MVRRINFITLVLCMAFFFSGNAGAQKVAVKTNLLYDATSTLNLGLEFGLSKNGHWMYPATTIRGLSMTTAK